MKTEKMVMGVEHWVERKVEYWEGLSIGKGNVDHSFSLEIDAPPIYPTLNPHSQHSTHLILHLSQCSILPILHLSQCSILPILHHSHVLSILPILHHPHHSQCSIYILPMLHHSQCSIPSQYYSTQLILYSSR